MLKHFVDSGCCGVHLGLEAAIGPLQFSHTRTQGAILRPLGLEEAYELLYLLLKFADFGVHGGKW